MAGPYLIVEAYAAREMLYDEPPRDDRLHLVPAPNAVRTYCGMTSANGTMIPLAAWAEGDVEYRWCRTCEINRNAALRKMERHGCSQMAGSSR